MDIKKKLNPILTKLKEKISVIKNPFDKADALYFSGVGLIVKGVAMYSHPLAFIVSGCACLFLFACATVQPRQQPQR